MKPGRFMPLLKWFLLFALVILASWYAYRHPELLTALRHVRLAHLAMLLGLALAGRALQALRFRLMTSALGADLGFREAFGLVMCNSMYGYLAPGRAGLGVLALYLKNRHGLSYAHFGSLVAASNLLQFLIAALVGLAACLLSNLIARPAPPVLVGAFLAILLLCLAGCVALAALAGLAAHIRTQFLHSLCVRVTNGMRMFWRRRDVLAKVAGLRVAEIGASVVALWIACSGVGLSVGLVALISMATLASVGMLLPLTPGSLGVSEGIISAAGHFWDLPTGTVVMAALVRRAVTVAVTFTLGAVSTYALMGALKVGPGKGTSAAKDTRIGQAEPGGPDRPKSPRTSDSVSTILVISISGLGNALLFTPALRALRKRHAGARIDILVEGPASRAVMETNPDVDRVLQLEYGRSRLRALLNVMKLRREGYDLSITAFPANKLRFALLSGIIGARERVAHFYPECPGISLDWIYTRRVPAERGLHDIQQNLRLVGVEETSRENLPRPTLHVREEDERRAEEYWSRIRPGPFVVGVHPGSGSSPSQQQTVKRWPLENYCEVLRALTREHGASVVVFCGPCEPELRAGLLRFAQGEGLQRIYFPEAGIGTVAALIKRCHCFLSGDTGLMHISTAVGTPVVALFGPTNPARTAPPWPDCTLLAPARACSPCLAYPFGTMRSSLDCRNPACWSEIRARTVVSALLDGRSRRASSEDRVASAEEGLFRDGTGDRDAVE